MPREDLTIDELCYIVAFCDTQSTTENIILLEVVVERYAQLYLKVKEMNYRIINKYGFPTMIESTKAKEGKMRSFDNAIELYYSLTEEQNIYKQHFIPLIEEEEEKPDNLAVYAIHKDMLHSVMFPDHPVKLVHVENYWAF